MKKIRLGTTGIEVPVIGLGSSRIKDLSVNEEERLLGAAIDQGINFFDHADGYGGGACEEVFGKALRNLNIHREKIFIQSKCGNMPGIKYDFSKEYILKTLEGSLKRLDTDYLDLLLLHRPDALAEPEEIAEAFNLLHESGKVRYFGVSNHKTMQIELLRKFVQQPIAVNQLQLSIANAQLIANGLNVNSQFEEAIERDGSVLDYCRLKDITIQTWSPFQYGKNEGVFLGSEKYPELNRTISEIAGKYGVSDNAVALAWLLRHPAKMQTIIGTVHPERLTQCIQALDITLSREEWYKIYLSAGHMMG
jgi:predicted oxidoreductase